MAFQLSLPYQLRTSDFDRYQRVKPASILDVFQDIAGLQAEGMGIGFDAMDAQGVFWAVTRTKIEIVRNPAMHAMVSARTWPHSPSRLMFLRDYEMLDATGALVAKGSSEWMLMNRETRTVEPLTDHYTIVEGYCEDRAFDKKVRRAKPFDIAEATAGPFAATPRPSDIDANGHVNNACYATYILDALQLGENEQVHTLQVDYRHEVHAGENLQIYVQRSGARISAQGMNEAGEAAFTCVIELRA